MWDGKKWDTGVTPKYEDWCRDRDEPVLVSTQSALSMTLMRQDEAETIRRSGKAALAAMWDLHSLDLGRDARSFKVRFLDLGVAWLTNSSSSPIYAKMSATT